MVAVLFPKGTNNIGTIKHNTMYQTQIKCSFGVHVSGFFFFIVVVSFTLVNSYPDLKCPKTNNFFK